MGLINRVFSFIFLLFILGACSDTGLSAANILHKIKSTPPPINIANKKNYSLNGTCSLAQSEIGIRIGVLSEDQVICSEDLTWEATGLDVSEIPDSKEVLIKLRQGDNASVKNGLLLEVKVIKDTRKPTVALDPPSFINANNQNRFVLEGDCSENGQTVSVSIGGLPDQTVDCTSLVWTLEADVSDLTTDTVDLLVDFTDAVGNPALQVSDTVDRDVVAPMVALTTTDLTITSANHERYSLEGTCEGSRNVIVTIGTLEAKTVNCENNGTWNLTNQNMEILEDGDAITIRVEQKDAFKNIGFVEEVIVKDTVHPTPLLTTSLFINTTNDGSYSLQGSCEGSEDVSITLNTQTESASCSSGQWNYSVDSNLLSEGQYELIISQEDQLGNEGVITPNPILVRDVTLPTASLNSDQDINSANASNYRPRGSCSEEGTVTITVASLPSATALCNGSSWQLNPGIDVSGLSDAESINMILDMEDVAGNTSNSTVTVSKDIISRAVAINIPTVINRVNETDYFVGGACSAHPDLMSLTVGGVSPTTEPVCSEGTWSASVDASSIDDGNSIAINISFGEGETQATDSETTLKDTEAPHVEIANTTWSINEENQSSYTLSGTCSENGQSVAVVIGDLSTQVSCSSGNWEVLAYDVSSLAGSSITITADLNDAAGNPADQATTMVDRDIVDPTVTLASTLLYIINKENVTQYNLEGSCEDGLDVILTLDDLSPWTLPCNSGSWALVDEDMTALRQGTDILLTVKQTDDVGNGGENSAILIKDTINPTLDLTSSLQVNANNVSAFLLEGDCSEEGELVTLTIASRPEVTTPCTSTGWQHTEDLETGLSDGDISLELSLEDAAGNTKEHSFTLNRDTVPPHLTMNTPLPPMSVENGNAYLVEGDCNNGDRVTLSIVGLSATPSVECGDSTTLPPLPNNRWEILTGAFSNVEDSPNITLKATVTDNHGNETHVSSTFAKDTTAPVVSIDDLVEINETNKTSYPLAGDCNENGKEVQVSAGSLTSSPSPICAGERWNVSMDLSTLTGAIDINALQRDDFNNLGSAPAQILVIEVIRQRFFYSRITAGSTHTCIITRESQVICWGNLEKWQMGDNQPAPVNDEGETVFRRFYPEHYVVVVDENGDTTGPLTGVISLAAGSIHTCALITTGQVRCWGGGGGRLGNDTNTYSNHAVTVVDGNGSTNPLTGVISLAVGSSHTCALTTAGRVWCWGHGDKSQLGNDSTTGSNHPVAVVDGDGSTNPLTNIVTLGAGGFHTCAVTSGGGALCWGHGALGQLGSSSEAQNVPGEEDPVGYDRDAPLPVLVGEGGTPLSGVLEIGGGSGHTCALLEDSGVKCWGSEFSGRLGNGENTYGRQYYPVDVLVTPGGALFTGATEMKTFSEGACVIMELEEELQCWGDNNVGELGHGPVGNHSTTPIGTLTGEGSSETLKSVRELAKGQVSTNCALPSKGGVLCWGANTRGELGDTTTTNRRTPVLVVDGVDGINSTGFFNNYSAFRRTYSCEQGANTSSCGYDPVDQILLALTSPSSTPSTSASISIEVSGLTTGDNLSIYNSKDCSGTAVATTTSNSSVTVNGLSEGAHVFHFKITASNSSVSSCSKSFLSYHYDATAPTAVTLSLTSTSGTNPTPEVRVSGIEPGNLISLYSDSNCSTSAASALRVNGVETDITVNTLATGDHTFYAQATDLTGNESSCSSGVTYTVNE